MAKHPFANCAFPGGFPGVALQFILPAAYFCLIFLFYPFRDAFYMDPDEGVNLAKAHLVLQGYRLYDDIWSDQPPILTHLLALVLRLFGLRVNLARLFILLLACAFVWAFFRFIQGVWGELDAVAGAFLLIFLPEFPNLSVSVMVGLPAIVFAAISLYFLAQWHRSRRVHYLFTSAFFLAFSILTKLFTAFLVPIFLTGILIDEYCRRQESLTWKKILAPALLWGAGFGFLMIALGLVLVKPHNLNQLLEVHIMARSIETFTSDESLTLRWHLRNNWLLIILALPGLIYTLISRRWLFLYPAVWMLVAGLLLARHYPVWYHQQLLVTIPATYLAAVACGEALKDFIQFWQRGRRINTRMLFGAFTLSLVVFLLFMRAPVALAQFNSSPSFKSPGLKDTSEQVHFLNRMSKYASKTSWVVTDAPIYAFWARLSIPPPLVVFNNKRLYTGELSDEEVLGIIQDYTPEQVLFTQYNHPRVEQYLQENYQLIYSRDFNRLYVRNDIAVNQPP